MKKLDRELGLFSVFSISCGAMLGPGLFVLPGLAYTIGGPATIMAYTAAGLLAIPAALSMAEMSTALPESGGPYLFLDRSLGPLAGALSGLGTWISLIFKSAFSLVGLGAYLIFMTGFSQELAIPVAVVIAGILIALNGTGGKRSGQVQAILVIFTLFVLTNFVGRGSLEVQRSHYHPFFTEGLMGFVAATAFVYVSYAGIAKVVSVAEEIRDPGRNIPWGIMLSLAVTILIYALVVYVIVGIVPGSELGKGAEKLMPLVQAGEALAGYWGMQFMAGVAVLALASMANAGLMAASRFPVPLARDQILPPSLARVNPRFSTPLISILLTGAILITFVLFLPVKNLAKLASAFLLLVFGLVNFAVIIFRESEIEWYRPDFEAPLYPFLQLFGFFTCVSLIFLMGWLPVIGAGALIVGCLVWYYAYARPRVDRVGAFFQSAADEDEIELFRRARTESITNKESVIVPFFGLEDADMLHVERRIRLAAALCDHDERLDVVDFVEVPEQTFLSDYTGESEEFAALEDRVQLLKNEIDSEIHLDQVITHSSRQALRNYAEQEVPHWIVLDWKEPSRWQFLIGGRKWWLEDFPCDVLLFEDRDRPGFEDILVMTEPGPYDGEVLYAADHVAEAFDGMITFLNPYDPAVRDEDFIRTYQEELESLCRSPSRTQLIETGDWLEEVVERAGEADLLILGDLSDPSFSWNQNDSPGTVIARRSECSVARVHSSLRSPRTIRRMEDEDEFDLMDYLSEENIFIGLRPGDKRDLFDDIARRMARDDSVSSDELAAALWDREAVQTTYIERGVAMPHGIVDELGETRVAIFQLEDSVSYTDEEDDVRICVVTLGPPSDRQTHLQIIGKAAELFARTRILDTMLQATDKTAVLHAIREQTS